MRQFLGCASGTCELSLFRIDKESKMLKEISSQNWSLHVTTKTQGKDQRRSKPSVSDRLPKVDIIVSLTAMSARWASARRGDDTDLRACINEKLYMLLSEVTWGLASKACG